MTDRLLPLTRRGLLAGLGGSLLAPFGAIPGVAQGRPALSLQATQAVLPPGSGKPDQPVWSLQRAEPGTISRFRRGEELEVTLDNRLPVPIALQWHGLDGAVGAEPLLGRPPLAAGSKETFRVALRHAGTLLADIRLLGDAAARPSRPFAIVVQEDGPASADRDEVLLIEDWRQRSDGSAVAPGVDARDASPLYTVNGLASLDITARINERLRLRIINGCQRNVIALKFEDHDVRVMAIDSQPAEPFPARNGALVLAPGTRIDVFIDTVRPAGSIFAISLHDGIAARPLARLVMSGDAPVRSTPLPMAPPLPANGLPQQLDLRNAQRIELPLGASPSDWLPPASLTAATAPAFRAKSGRTVVLTLTNRAAIPTVFHLHGHHFRLLDRLDDGWKPFWLDTLVIDAGQTQRVAFAAYPGRWLVQAMTTDWSAPRLVRWFAIE